MPMRKTSNVISSTTLLPITAKPKYRFYFFYSWQIGCHSFPSSKLLHFTLIPLNDSPYSNKTSGLLQFPLYSHHIGYKFVRAKEHERTSPIITGKKKMKKPTREKSKKKKGKQGMMKKVYLRKINSIWKK